MQINCICQAPTHILRMCYTIKQANMIRKLVLAIFLALSPVSFIFFTTPFNQLSDHMTHIALFIILGVATGAYIMKDELFRLKVKKHKFSLLPSFQFIVFLFLLGFIATHLMPCPYMYSPQTAQTMIDHPCSQPAMPTVACLSFIPVITHVIVIKESSPKVIANDPVQTFDPRSPPLI